MGGGISLNAQCDSNPEDCDYRTPRFIKNMPEHYKNNSDCYNLFLSSSHNVAEEECGTEIELLIDLTASNVSTIPVNSLSDFNYFAVRFYFLDDYGSTIPMDNYYPQPNIKVLGGSQICPSAITGNYNDYGLQATNCNISSPYYDPISETCLFPYDNGLSYNTFYVMENQNLNDLLDPTIKFPPSCNGCANNGATLDKSDLLSLLITELPIGCSTIIYEMEYQNLAGDVCFYHDGMGFNRGAITCSSVSDSTPDPDCNNATSNTSIVVTDDCDNTYESTTDNNGDFCITVPDEEEGCFKVKASCTPPPCEDRDKWCVNFLDLQILQRIILGTLTPSPLQCITGDANRDGKVNGLDLNAIVQTINCLDQDGVGACVLFPTSLLAATGDITTCIEYREEIELAVDFEYCDGVIPPMSNLIIGDVNGDCGCEDTDISIGFRSTNVDDMNLRNDHIENLEGNSLDIQLLRDHEVLSLRVVSTDGRQISKFNIKPNVYNYSIDLPVGQQGIYIIQYMYVDGQENAIIPILR